MYNYMSELSFKPNLFLHYFTLADYINDVATSLQKRHEEEYLSMQVEVSLLNIAIEPLNYFAGKMHITGTHCALPKSRFSMLRMR